MYSLENKAESFLAAVILLFIFEAVVGFGVAKKDSLLRFSGANRVIDESCCNKLSVLALTNVKNFPNSIRLLSCYNNPAVQNNEVVLILKGITKIVHGSDKVCNISDKSFLNACMLLMMTIFTCNT